MIDPEKFENYLGVTAPEVFDKLYHRIFNADISLCNFQIFLISTINNPSII